MVRNPGVARWRRTPHSTASRDRRDARVVGPAGKRRDRAEQADRSADRRPRPRRHHVVAAIDRAAPGCCPRASLCSALCFELGFRMPGGPASRPQFRCCGVSNTPFWPVIFTVARFGAAAEPSLLTTSPLRPPGEVERRSVRRERPGAASKVVRRRALKLSTRADGFDVELTLEVEREVGELVVGGAQVDPAPQRLVEQRGRDVASPSLESARTGVVGEVDPRADGADVGVVEQLALRKRHGDAPSVGFAGRRR